MPPKDKLGTMSADIGGGYAHFQLTLLDFLGEMEGFEAKTPEEWYELAQGVETYDNAIQGDEVVMRFKAFIATLPMTDMNQPTAYEALTAKQGDHAPIDNPTVWKTIEKTVAAMNKQGMQLHADSLLNEDGTPNELLQRAINLGKAAAFFTRENWLGASKADLQAVLRTLPPKTLKSVTNHQQLLIALERQNRHERGV